MKRLICLIGLLLLIGCSVEEKSGDELIVEWKTNNMNRINECKSTQQNVEDFCHCLGGLYIKSLNTCGSNMNNIPYARIENFLS